MRWRLAILMILVAAIIPLCAQQTPQKPTVVVDDIKVEGGTITPGKGATMNLTVRVIVSNPNPVGAHLTKIVYDIYLLDDKELYLGHGKKEDVTIRKQGDTAIEIPTTLEMDIQTFDRILESFKEHGSIKLKISGSAYLDLKVKTFEIPFEKVEIIALPPIPTPTPTPTRTPTPTPTPTSTPVAEETVTPTPTPTPTPKPKLIVSVEPSPAKVGQTVTIKVTDENGNPVEGVWVGYVGVAQAVFSGGVIENLNFIGKTDENGVVTYKFTKPDLYYIGAKKLGYQFGYTELRVKLLS